MRKCRSINVLLTVSRMLPPIYPRNCSVESVCDSSTRPQQDETSTAVQVSDTTKAEFCVIAGPHKKHPITQFFGLKKLLPYCA